MRWSCLVQLKGKMILCYEPAELSSSDVAKQNHQHKQHVLLNLPGHSPPASLLYQDPGCALPLFSFHLQSSDLSSEKSWVSAKGQGKHFCAGGTCVRACVMNILSTVWSKCWLHHCLWVQKTGFIVQGSLFWAHCPILWVQQSRWCPRIFCRVVSIPIKGETVPLSGKCCRNCHEIGGTGECDSRAAEREGEAGPPLWYYSSMLGQEVFIVSLG